MTAENNFPHCGSGADRDGQFGSGADRDGQFGSGEKRNKRSVWTVAAQPYRGSHFATFPPNLIKPCILAGTSDAGCCSTCGAPRERMAKTRAAQVDDVATSRGDRICAPGWRQSCDCFSLSQPCVVLDPFMGAGTTAHVAQDFGRRWIGCELNPEYENLILRRTAQTSLALI